MDITNVNIECAGTDTSTWVVAQVAEMDWHTTFSELRFRLTILKATLSDQGIWCYLDQVSSVLYIENISDRYITVLTLKYPRFEFIRFDCVGRLYIPTGNTSPGVRVNI